jgi:hypothetical protein
VSHFQRLSKSEFTAFSIPFKHSPAAVILVSSANSRGFVLFTHAGKSLIYIAEKTVALV